MGEYMISKIIMCTLHKTQTQPQYDVSLLQFHKLYHLHMTSGGMVMSTCTDVKIHIYYVIFLQDLSERI